jgi:hypothetical protein
MFPDTGMWFRAHSETTDEYFKRVDFQSLVHGDELEVPSKINQDNADKLVEGYLAHLFAQTDFASRVDRINAEAFKYGMGVGRARMETKNVYIHESRASARKPRKFRFWCRSRSRTFTSISRFPRCTRRTVLSESHIAVDYMKWRTFSSRRTARFVRSQLG